MSITYTLNDNAGGKFALNASTGLVTVAGALAQGTYTINVTAADSVTGWSSTKDFSIPVGPAVAVPAPTLSLSSAVTQAEGNSGTTAFVWTLTLNRDGSTASFPFTWAVTGSGPNPADAADFGGTFPSGSGTFAPGETSKTITVLVAGDTAVEPNETFTLTVTAAGLNTVTSTGTISNDDVAPTVPAILTVNADGWSGDLNPDFGAIPAYSTSLSELDPEGPGKREIIVTSAGFADGVATTRTRAVVATKRVRKTWTAGGQHLTPDGNRAALSEIIMQGDTWPGMVANNSTETGYPAFGHWLTRYHRVVGDSAYVQVHAGHWSGREQKPVDSVWAWYRSVDGTKQTNKVKLSGPKQLPGAKDRGLCVTGYDGNIPTATWSDGTAIPDGTPIIREFDAYSFLGSMPGTTVGGTVDARGMSPWTDYKHTARATNPVYAFVSTTGTDETVNSSGVGGTTATQKISTNIATARANTFATVTSAIQALKAATGLTGGFTDGCIIYIRAGTYTQSGNTTAQTYQSGGELIIATDPNDADYSVTYNLTGYAQFRQTWVSYQRINFVKTVTASGLPANFNIVNCKVDGGNFNSSFFNGVATIDGIEVTNFPANAAALLHPTGGALIMRGVLASGVQVDGFNLCASILRNCSVTQSTRTQSGTILNGVFLAGGGLAINPGTGETTVTGVAWINVIAVNVTNTSTILISASRDNNSFDIRNFLRAGVTEIGSGDAGRRNQGYDESTTVGVRRSNRVWVEVGVIATSSYIKSDVIYGANLGGTEAEAATRTGSWPVLYGVGRKGVLHLTEPNANTGPNFGPGGSENHAFFGLKVRTLAGRTSAYQQLDVKFAGGLANCTRWNGSSVLAGDAALVNPEDFMLLSDSPAIGVLSAADEVIPFDIFGNPRDRGSLGACR